MALIHSLKTGILFFRRFSNSNSNQFFLLSLQFSGVFAKNPANFFHSSFVVSRKTNQIIRVAPWWQIWYAFYRVGSQ
jgi:hypothetical protein